MENQWLEFAKKVHAIAVTGLTYKTNEYDIERYEELKKLSFNILSQLSTQKVELIESLFQNERGYQTPKVDVRGVVLRGNKILLVQEKVDNCWTLPGGWADVGLSPNENVVKEIWEESGLIVQPQRLLAILDKKCHDHPPTPWYCYKIFILCSEVGGELKPGLETLNANFFNKTELPPLSTERITEGQIKIVYDLIENPILVRCD